MNIGDLLALCDRHVIVLLYWMLFGMLLCKISAVIFSASQLQSTAIIVFLVGFSARVVLVGLNESAGILPAKVQGTLSLSLFHHYVIQEHNLLGLLREPFGAQVIWNLSPWTFCGPTRLSLLIGNSAASALFAPMLGLMLYRSSGRNVCQIAMFLASLYLASWNFSIFGLRDPLLLLGYGILSCYVVRIGILGYSKADLVGALLTSLLVIWLRPEMFYVVAFFAGIPVCNFYLKSIILGWRRKRIFRTAALLTPAVVMVGILGAAVATRIVGKNVGVQTSNPFQLADENAETRFNRSAGALSGGDSHVVDAQSYANMPIYKRVPLQIAGLIVCPFPWQVTSPARLFAFIDSIYLWCICGIGLWATLVGIRHHWNTSGASIRPFVTAFWMFSAFALGIVGMGLVVSNAGNAFRMRLAVVPIAIVAGSLVFPAVLPMVKYFRLGFGAPPSINGRLQASRVASNRKLMLRLHEDHLVNSEVARNFGRTAGIGRRIH